jgi:hypothetical protein
MDSTFVSGCEGAGLALASGLVAGSLAGAGNPARRPLAVLAAAAGAALFAVALDSSGHRFWPGLLLGPLCAVLAYTLAASLVAGAARRRGAGAGTLAGFVALAGLVVAALALVVAPVSLAVLAAVIVLVVARRGREGRKYEGLRVLR